MFLIKIKTQKSVLEALIFVLIKQRLFQVNVRNIYSAVSHSTELFTVAEIKSDHSVALDVLTVQVTWHFEVSNSSGVFMY